mmetsp:Transcript_18836/g.39284  ORF Transcript_18836/g.39284 Transcript_18836/m.39284 type:complete len:261 (+) Transcript_18836:595-1377(+)
MLLINVIPLPIPMKQTEKISQKFRSRRTCSKAATLEPLARAAAEDDVDAPASPSPSAVLEFPPLRLIREAVAASSAPPPPLSLQPPRLRILSIRRTLMGHSRAKKEASKPINSKPRTGRFCCFWDKELLLMYTTSSASKPYPTATTRALSSRLRAGAAAVPLVGASEAPRAAAMAPAGSPSARLSMKAAMSGLKKDWYSSVITDDDMPKNPLMSPTASPRSCGKFRDAMGTAVPSHQPQPCCAANAPASSSAYSPAPPTL